MFWGIREIIITSLIFFLTFLSFRAVYLAFIKKKDERSKWIVTKSMAESFIVIAILQSMLMAFKLYDYELFQVWWRNFKVGLEIEPVILSFMILGVILLINTKKHGGS